ncbi:efflux RND transporter periplasmic adaptor subunit [Paludisphaera soli]|uniref:efflux RND transporter periplasmic adaptor subunit n=1 Tax=Paludisphaera soli TaxID=2712865 RepID=UPI0013EE1D64|nr:efflux RND transporter periplasmic adaptor subunit [Paludisphaera soli]
MAAKLLWSMAGVLLTCVVVWRAGEADWGRPSIFTKSSPPGGEAAIVGRNPLGRQQNSVLAEGRLVTYPGAEVAVAAELAGRIVQIHVRERSVVSKGDLIAELASEDLNASRAEAQARIDEAEAEIGFYEREVLRSRGLIVRHAASSVELEMNLRSLGTTRARQRAALASRARFEVLIAKMRIISPIDGVVIARSAHPGETVAAAARLVTIADLERVRIEAEVDEVDLGSIALEADARITAESFPGRVWRGKVEEVPDVVVGRQLRPEDTTRPVDMRVLLVKIALLERTPLKLGQRVEVEIGHGPP